MIGTRGLQPGTEVVLSFMHRHPDSKNVTNREGHAHDFNKKFKETARGCLVMYMKRPCSVDEYILAALMNIYMSCTVLSQATPDASIWDDDASIWDDIRDYVRSAVCDDVHDEYKAPVPHFSVHTVNYVGILSRSRAFCCRHLPETDYFGVRQGFIVIGVG